MASKYINKFFFAKSNLEVLGMVILVIIFFVNTYIFSMGYRLTADEVAFHLYSMGSIRSVVSYANQLSESQGRVGQHIISLLNIFSSNVSSSIVYRMIFSFLFLLSYLSFFYYLSKLINKNTTIDLMLTFFAVCPLMFHHMAPNAFPLQNTIPFLIITVIKTISIGKNIKNPIYLILYFLAIISSEYAFIFAFTLILMDVFISFIYGNYNGVDKHDIKRYLSEFILILLCASLYLLYRALHPSTYDGNQVVDIPLFRVAYVTAMHIWNGVSFSQLHLAGFNSVWILLSCVMGILSFVVAISYKYPKITAGDCAIVIPLMLTCSVLVVLPVALTPKMQNWCIDFGECAFLSSRSALYFAVPFVYFTIRYVKFRKEIWYLGILFLTTLTSLSNIYVAAQMKTYVTPFDRIERSACNLRWQDIDPTNSIVMHPGFDRTIYWKTYLADAQTAQSCHRNISQFADRAPKTQAISE